MDLYDYYQNYYNLTKQQKEKIQNNEINDLSDLIEKKHEIIKQIEAKTDLKDYLNKKANPEEAFAELKELMGKIHTLEKENTNSVQDKKTNLLSKMNDLNQKAKSRKSYLEQNKYEAKFIDKKS